MGDKKTLREAQSMLTSTSENLTVCNHPKWLPDEYVELYYDKDLDYVFCLKQFSRIEAAKREKIPETTMRSWFIEFIRLGWTKELVKNKTDILMSVKVYGVDKLEIADWIKAEKEPVMNKEAYEMFKPQGEKQTGGLEGLRKLIDDLDGKTERAYYIDRHTNEKVYYPELPDNWRGNFIAEWRQGERIKKEHRRIK